MLNNGMKTIHAVYENGVFRPLEAVGLPERTEVEVVPKPQQHSLPADEGLKAIKAILSERYDGGEPDDAARHNEHQP